MADTKIPLLSILIPTKNRQFTCLYAIESVLLLKKDDVEIIVQDCSDSDILKKQISEKFGTGTTISYEYLDTKPSMTDNWNRAYERATGLYKCGIGDDDAVLPGIYDIARWAKENNIDAVGHSKRWGYFWPDYTTTPQYASGLISTHSSISDNFKIYERKDLEELIKVQAAIPDMNYRKLPLAYHCLLSGSLIENLIKKTGKFLDGTSLDVYSAFLLGLTVNKFYVYNIPFTLPGACGASNSNRIAQKNFSNHFSEFTKITPDKRIPRLYNLTFTIAESTQKALNNLNDHIYSQLLDLPYLYADFLSHSFNLKMIRNLYSLMKITDFKRNDYVKFIRLFAKKVSYELWAKVKAFVRKILSNFKYFEKRISKRSLQNITIYKSGNILEAVELINTGDIL